MPSTINGRAIRYPCEPIQNHGKEIGMKKAILAATAAGVLALATSSFAEPGHGPGGGDGMGPGGPGGQHGGGMGFMAILQDEDLAREFGLTDKQIDAAQAAAKEHRKQAIRLRGDVELARMELQELMDSDKPDREAVMKAVDKVGATELALEKSNVDLKLQLRDIVGADTMKKIRAKMREERQERRQEDQRRGPQGGGGR
jgi:Spy/CpxP family protein refolding chaperone